MRNHILPISIAVVLAAPCTALAGDKKDTIEVLQPSFGVNHQQASSTSGRIGPDRIQHKHIGGVKYEDVQTQPKAPTTGKPITTTVNPALQGNVLQNRGVGSLKFSPEITRSHTSGDSLINNRPK